MVMESANVAGITAATKTANIESLTLLRTDVPPFVRRRAAKASAVSQPSRCGNTQNMSKPRLKNLRQEPADSLLLLGRLTLSAELFQLAHYC
jgi:hypothetical protein